MVLLVNLDAIVELNLDGIGADSSNSNQWLISKHKNYDLAEQALNKLERKNPNKSYDLWDEDEE
jgi:hypothetical protein